MNDAFQDYRKEVEKDSVLKDFRRDIFKKDSIPEHVLQADKLYDKEQDKI